MDLGLEESAILDTLAFCPVWILGPGFFSFDMIKET